MKALLKKIIKRIFAAFGYEINRLGTHLPPAIDISIPTPVMVESFKNLSHIYEHVLNETEGNGLILPNEIRPKLLARLLGTPPSEAYFIVLALAKTSFLDGDVCEFGVAQGETSALIANEIALLNNKVFHLFDSFEGLPKPSEKDKLKEDIFSLGSMDAYAGTMSYPEDMVKARLDAVSFPSKRYLIHKGFIERLLYKDKQLPKRVSFAYVDFDFYEPIKLTLDFLHGVTPNGAIIIVDDYNFFSTGAKTAVDEFIKEQNLNGEKYNCFIPAEQYGYFAVLTKIK